MSSLMYTPPPQDQLNRNPMLPMHPVQAAADAQYRAQEAILRAQTAKQYADILQQLGYTDAKGNFIPGSVSTGAAQQQQELERSSNLAAENVTNAAQRTNTLFSGRRATQTARAEYPFQQQIAQLGVDTPLSLANLHEQAAGLIDQYTLQNNSLLADAASRMAQGAIASPGASSRAPQPYPGGVSPGPGGLNPNPPGTPPSVNVIPQSQRPLYYGAGY